MSPVSTGSSTALSVDYRYILTDTLTDNIIAELPFVDVSYSTGLNEAGAFSGSFPITEDTAVKEIYKNTVPGKTSLYVLREGVCVWGGIISARSYDVKEKILDVTADEFLSYLDRRVLWKTWSAQYDCEIEIFEDQANNRFIGKVTLAGDSTHEDFDLEDGVSKVSLYFGEKYFPYNLNNPYTVLDDTYNIYQTDTVNYKYFYFSAYYKAVGQKNFRAMKPARIDSSIAKVEFRQQSDDYLDTLLNEHFADDVKDLTFATDDVAPGNIIRLPIYNYSRAANSLATIVVDGPPEIEIENYEHFLVPGQIISIKNVNSFNDSFLPVVSVDPDERTFTYQSSGGTASNTLASTSSVGVIRFTRESNIVTIVTETNHGLSVGQIVEVSGVDPRIDSNVYYRVTRLGTSIDTANTLTKFQFSAPGEDIDVSVTDPITTVIFKTPFVEFHTGGSFTGNSDIGITFTTPENLLTSVSQSTRENLRGAEVFTFKEIIDKYSRETDLIGFDYRIQCTFTPNEPRLFSKQFKFLPLVPDSLEGAISSLAGGVLPADELPKISYFQIDGRNAKDLSFEFPGNITSVSMQETLEEGATRVFAQGKSDLDPPPYAAAADHSFLRVDADGRRWPLFDKVIKKDKVYYNNNLQVIANKTLSQAQLPVATFSITVNGTLFPKIGSYFPGDWCIISIDDLFINERLLSYSENKGDTSRAVLLRKINKISVQLSNNPVLPEEVTLELVTEPGVDITGKERAWR